MFFTIGIITSSLLEIGLLLVLLVLLVLLESSSNSFNISFISLNSSSFGLFISFSKVIFKFLFSSSSLAIRVI